MIPSNAFAGPEASRGVRAGRPCRRGGQTTVEFALIVFPFLLLLLATCDYAQLYYYESSMRHALREAGRFATTGLVLGTRDTNSILIPKTSLVSPPNPMSRNESIRYKYTNACVVFFEPDDITIESWSEDGLDGTSESSPRVGPGNAEDFVRISIEREISFVTPVANLLIEGGKYTLRVSSVFRNEPSQNFKLYTNRYASEPQ